MTRWIGYIVFTAAVLGGWMLWSQTPSREANQIRMNGIQEKLIEELGAQADPTEVWLVTGTDAKGNRMRCSAMPETVECPLCDGSRISIVIAAWGQDHRLSARCWLTLRSTGQLETDLSRVE